MNCYSDSSMPGALGRTRRGPDPNMKLIWNLRGHVIQSDCVTIHWNQCAQVAASSRVAPGPSLDLLLAMAPPGAPPCPCSKARGGHTSETARGELKASLDSKWYWRGDAHAWWRHCAQCHSVLCPTAVWSRGHAKAGPESPGATGSWLGPNRCADPVYLTAPCTYKPASYICMSKPCLNHV